MFRKLKLALVSLSLIVFSLGVAQADTVTVSGDTFLPPPAGTRDGFFTRPQGETEPPGTGLSTIGTNVAYDSILFTVSQTGSYNFLLTSLEVEFYDPFLALYANSFNPASGLTNLINRNDDLTPGDFTRSGFTQTLTAGTSYFAVVTGFGNFDSGFFTLRIDGPGIITIGGGPTAVPEPATMILLGIGLVGIGAAARRRRCVVNETEEN